MFSLKITPVSMCGTPYFFWTIAPWVPLPLPFGPKIRMFILVLLLSTENGFGTGATVGIGSGCMRARP